MPPPEAVLQSVGEGVARAPAEGESSVASGAHDTTDAQQPVQTTSRRGPKRERHLAPGPVALSWAGGLATLSLQALLTDKARLEHDARALSGALSQLAFSGQEAVQHVLETPAVQYGVLYAVLYMITLSTSFALIPSTFPALQSEPDVDGKRTALEVPFTKANMVQHQLNKIDYSYMILNSLCMPGLFYHFYCLMSNWGFDPNAPPLFGIYPPSASQILMETVPELAFTVSFYFVVYEFIYYWWHRAMHEVPFLYIWVHKHHHQQTYPDRAAVDTLNTHCVESQLGLYMQLAVLWLSGMLFGIASLPGGIWFFTIAGWLSVLEHDKFDRALPFNTWRADEHHMHHAYVRCNYSPYSTLWDRVFGTHKPFEVKEDARNSVMQEGGALEQGYSS